MATTTINNYTGNGITDSFLVGFDYLRKAFVNVYLNEQLQELGVDYEFSTDNVITFTTAPNIGVAIVIMRNTLIKETIVNYIDPAILSANDLNKSFLQPLHLIEETQDVVSKLEITRDESGNIDLDGKRVINSGQPINDNDLATKKYVDDNDNQLQDFIESVDRDLISLSNDINNSIDGLSNIVIDNNNNLQNQIDSIQVGGVQISSDVNNAITVEADGLYVPNLSASIKDLSDIVIDNVMPNVEDLTSRVNLLDNDSTAQWVKINDTFNKVAVNTANIGSNTTDINTIDNRVTELENTSSGGGGGFNVIEYITSSNSAYTPTVDGWYKLTIIGGGGGGGGGGVSVSAQTTGGCGGGGGAAGKARIIYKYLTNSNPISITIGSYGTGGASSGAGSTGGSTTISIPDDESISVGGGSGGGAGNANINPGLAGIGGGSAPEVAGVGGNGNSQSGGTSPINGGLGGNGGSNKTPYGSGGGGGGGGNYKTSAINNGGIAGGVGAISGSNGLYSTSAGVNAAGGAGGRGASGAVILEYFDPSL